MSDPRRSPCGLPLVLDDKERHHVKSELVKDLQHWSLHHSTKRDTGKSCK